MQSFVAMNMNKCAKFHKDSPSDKKVKFISRARLNFRRRPFLCTTLYGNLIMQASNFDGTFDQLFLWIFYAIFTEDASLLRLYHGPNMSKMTKNSNQGGPTSIFVFFFSVIGENQCGRITRNTEKNLHGLSTVKSQIFVRYLFSYFCTLNFNTVISFGFEALECQRLIVVCHEALKSTKISSNEPVSSQKYENGYWTKICDFTVSYLPAILVKYMYLSLSLSLW